MDQNSYQFEIKKKEAINKITGILIEEMAQKKIDHSKGQEIATYILNQIKIVKDEFNLSDFLKLLSEKYSIFEKYYIATNLQNNIKKTDDEKINSIMSQLSNLANFQTK